MINSFEDTTELNESAHLLMRMCARRYLGSRGLPDSPVLGDSDIVDVLHSAHGLDPVRKDVWDTTPGSESAPAKLHGHLMDVLAAVGIELPEPATPYAIAIAFEQLI